MIYLTRFLSSLKRKQRSIGFYFFKRDSVFSRDVVVAEWLLNLDLRGPGPSHVQGTVN